MSTDAISGRVLPISRTSDLVIQNLENELLVYDLRTNKAHQLNETMSLIWTNCNGKTTVSALLGILEERFGKNLDEDLVEFALSELDGKDLFSQPLGTQFSKVSRRDVAFKYAPMAIALPIVLSLIAPTAVQAQSCVQPGQPCNTEQDCCTATLCFDPVGNQSPPVCVDIGDLDA
ncbi:MAG: PqqD family protein [Pyrinomonadaceae bacterium]